MFQASARSSWHALAALAMIAASLLSFACSRTHDGTSRGHRPDDAPSAGPPPSTAGTAGAATQPVQSLPDSGAPPSVDVPAGSVLPSVAEKLEELVEPDFEQSSQALAEQRCGHVFRIDELTSSPSNEMHAEVTRVFDRDGRLLVAEETATGDDYFLLDKEIATRLQLDRDSSGRVERLRERWRAGVGVKDELGTVIDFTYASDGGYEAEMVTTQVGPLPSKDGRPWLDQPAGFCERMEFDAGGRLMRTSWGCDDDEEVARVFRYDVVGSLVEVTGKGFGEFYAGKAADGRFGDAAEWTIRFDHGTDGRLTVVWNEMDLRGDQPVEVEQRLVRSFDARGRIVSTEFDYGNDGSIDERTDYAYADDTSEQWIREAYDFGLDGVIDIVEERSGDGARQIIERRNMAQWGDETRFHFSVRDSYAYGGRGHAIGPMSAVLRTLEFDDDRRLVGAELELRTALGSLVTRDVSERMRQSAFAQQAQRFAAQGYVEHVELSAGESRESPEDMHREARCSLQAVCEGGAMSLLDDPALLACQTASGIASPVLRLPVIQPSYIPPPFDRIAAMRARSQYVTRFEPLPPTVREIVGY